jgi:hypothetical protein
LNFTVRKRRVFYPARNICQRLKLQSKVKSVHSLERKSVGVARALEIAFLMQLFERASLWKS